MLQKAVGCTTTMPISGRQGSAVIGLPVQPAVVPTVAPVVPAAVAPIVPTAIAPTAVAPSAVAPAAVAPPGKLCLGVNPDNRLAAASADARLTERPRAPAGNKAAKARAERRSWAM